MAKVEIALIKVGPHLNLEVISVDCDEMICSCFAGCSIHFYESMFIQLNFRLHKFEEGVLKHLKMSPSQLHPNAWALVKAF